MKFVAATAFLAASVSGFTAVGPQQSGRQLVKNVNHYHHVAAAAAAFAPAAVVPSNS
jgi:hypothetical protein